MKIIIEIEVDDDFDYYYQTDEKKLDAIINKNIDIIKAAIIEEEDV